MPPTPHPRRRVTRPAAELSSNSAAVMSDAEQQPVTIVRNKGEDLVLLTKFDYEVQSDLIELAGIVLTAIPDTPTLEAGLAQAYPWMLALSDEDRGQCAEDLVNAVRSVGKTGQGIGALSILNSWRESAEAIAAGLADSPAEWLEEKPVVPRP